MRRPLGCIVMGLVVTASVVPRRALAQHAADISGTWIYNARLSDNPRDRLQAADSGVREGAEGRGGRRGGFGGGRGGFGGFGGGRRGGGGEGGMGGGGGGGERRPGMSDEERARMRQTMHLAFDAPRTLTIAATDTTVALTTDSVAALVLYADGRKLKQKVDSGGDLEIKGHWQGNDFVVERKVSGGGKVTEDYLRSQDGKQLFVIVSFDGGRGRSIDFRRVYDTVGS